MHSNPMEKACQCLGSIESGHKAWGLSAVAAGLCPALRAADAVGWSLKAAILMSIGAES